jgi:adenylate cyclase
MPGPTVLVVDDDPVIVKLLQVNFEMEGYNVLTASDGEEGLAKARESMPDVIVLDVMMPKMDGLQVAGELRGDTATSGIPILLVSAKAQAGDIQAGREVANDYVTKPFDPLDLLERVAKLISHPR